MKALSIKQPWAWLIVNGIKDIENRDWRINRKVAPGSWAEMDALHDQLFPNCTWDGKTIFPGKTEE